MTRLASVREEVLMTSILLGAYLSYCCLTEQY